MANKHTPTEIGAWVTTMAQHEGAPIALRVRPNANTPANRDLYSVRVAVVHELSNVTSNGLPEAEYNNQLAEFDDEVHRCLEGDGDGLVVLVETFSGRRIYFSYVRSDANVDGRLEKLKARFPQHTLRSKASDDGDWEAYEHYRKLFPW